MRWQDARAALVRERLSARGAEAALLLAGERGTVQIGARLRVSRHGDGDYEVRAAYTVDGERAPRWLPYESPEAAERTYGGRPLQEIPAGTAQLGTGKRRGLRLIRGGQS